MIASPLADAVLRGQVLFADLDQLVRELARFDPGVRAVDGDFVIHLLERTRQVASPSLTAPWVRVRAAVDASCNPITLQALAAAGVTLHRRRPSQPGCEEVEVGVALLGLTRPLVAGGPLPGHLVVVAPRPQLVPWLAAVRARGVWITVVADQDIALSGGAPVSDRFIHLSAVQTGREESEPFVRRRGAVTPSPAGGDGVIPAQGTAEWHGDLWMSSIEIDAAVPIVVDAICSRERRSDGLARRLKEQLRPVLKDAWRVGALVALLVGGGRDKPARILRKLTPHSARSRLKAYLEKRIVLRSASG